MCVSEGVPICARRDDVLADCRFFFLTVFILLRRSCYCRQKVRSSDGNTCDMTGIENDVSILGGMKCGSGAAFWSGAVVRFTMIMVVGRR